MYVRAIRFLLLTAAVVIATFAIIGPARALPVYSRQYKVACSVCHLTVPRLNKFGLAFQANYYNWPGETRVARQDPTRYLPVSTITTFSYDHDQTQRQESAAFRSFEIFASDGLNIGRAHEKTSTLTPAILHSLDKKDADNDGFPNALEIKSDTLPGDPRSHPDGPPPPAPDPKQPFRSALPQGYLVVIRPLAKPNFGAYILDDLA